MKRVWITTICVVLIVALAGLTTACTVGSNGLSAYDIAVKNGFVGTEAEWLASLSEGESAYDIAVKNGFVGTEAEWLASLKGTDGEDGEDATFTIDDVYEAYKRQYLQDTGEEYTGTFGDFLHIYFEDTYRLVSTEAMAAEAVLSCVSVYSYYDQVGYTGNIWQGYHETTQRVRSGGAGVIYRLDKESGSAYIITNYHVIYNASAKSQISDDIEVLLYGYESYSSVDSNGYPDYQYAIPAKYVGGSMKLDIAVLYVENSDILKNSNARAATIGDSTLVAVGQDAVAIGNPEASGISVTSGIISVDSEYITMTAADDTTMVTFRVIRIDTAINGGNSGGGLFNAYGELVGIVNAKVNSSSVDNIAYAIPVNIAVYTAEGIIERFEAAGKVGQYAATKFLVGITVSAAESYSYYDPEYQRAHIVQKVVVAAEPAETAAAYGLLHAGDVIKTVTLRGVTYEATRTFVVVDLMLRARAGDTVTFTYERDGVEGTADIVVTTPVEIDKI